MANTFITNILGITSNILPRALPRNLGSYITLAFYQTFTFDGIDWVNDRINGKKKIKIPEIIQQHQLLKKDSLYLLLSFFGFRLA